MVETFNDSKQITDKQFGIKFVWLGIENELSNCFTSNKLVAVLFYCQFKYDVNCIAFITIQGDFFEFMLSK